MEGTLERPFHLLVCGFLICFLFHEAASHISLSFSTHPVAKTTTLLLSHDTVEPSRGPHHPCSSARCCRSPRQPLHASTRTRQYACKTRSHARLQHGDPSSCSGLVFPTTKPFHHCRGFRSAPVAL